MGASSQVKGQEEIKKNGINLCDCFSHLCCEPVYTSDVTTCQLLGVPLIWVTMHTDDART
jgi:hypothetical protein